MIYMNIRNFKNLFQPKKLLNNCMKRCSQLKKTALYDFHIRAGAKMIPFMDWEMPGSYEETSMNTAVFIRKNCGLFDVSHMYQFIIHGDKSEEFLEQLVPADLKSLPNNKGVYTLLLNDNGGIEDDLMINKITKEQFYVISSAARADIVFKTITDQLKNRCYEDITFEPILNRALIALQGPMAYRILKPLLEIDMDNLKFLDSSNVRLMGIETRITRCGYTGEDGFELSFPSKKAIPLVENIMSVGAEKICLGGLITLDILRTEAGLCLYGHDINTFTTPIEAGLVATIGTRRRRLLNFPGAQKISYQLKNGSRIKRIGFISDKRIPRVDYLMFDDHGSTIGHVTSGTRSPQLQKNIGIGYIDKAYSEVGCVIKIGPDLANSFTAQVCSLPFIPTKYKI